MKDHTRFRRMCIVVSLLAVFMTVAGVQFAQHPWQYDGVVGDAGAALAMLPLSQQIFSGKYERGFFGDGWESINGCDMRNIILRRDLADTAVSGTCVVLKGTLNDPYTGGKLAFSRGATTSSAVQIDHVVSLKDAWQKGAYSFNDQKRHELANDPLELVAVDGRVNQQKSDGDAADWLPPNSPFQCQYVARQVAVKQKYGLSVTNTEKQAMGKVLAQCPWQSLPKK